MRGFGFGAGTHTHTHTSSDVEPSGDGGSCVLLPRLTAGASFTLALGHMHTHSLCFPSLTFSHPLWVLEGGKQLLNDARNDPWMSLSGFHIYLSPIKSVGSVGGEPGVTAGLLVALKEETRRWSQSQTWQHMAAMDLITAGVTKLHMHPSFKAPSLTCAAILVS